VRRRRPAGEAGDGQVEGTPEEVDGARLADEPGAEVAQNPIGLDEGSPGPGHRIGVVAGVVVVVAERGGPLDLDRHRPDRRAQLELVEAAHDLGVEVGHRSRFEGHRSSAAVGGGDLELVRLEVEIDLETAAGAVGYERRREARAVT
jgi:hypothetical protein